MCFNVQMYAWPRTLLSEFDVTIHVDIHGYDTGSAENMDLYIPRCTKGIYKRIILYNGSSLWNKLPPWVKKSSSLNDFKHNFRLLNGWIHPEFIVLLYAFIFLIVYICVSYIYVFYFVTYIFDKKNPPPPPAPLGFQNFPIHLRHP